MQDLSNLQAPVSTESASSADVPTREPWQKEAAELLRRVAAMCVEHEVDVQTFMQSAWSTYVDARPGMREELEEQQLAAQLKELREAGKLGLA
jgi:hypothetical protein